MIFKTLGRIFGSDTIVNKGLEVIDELYYSSSEKAEDKAKAEKAKVTGKIDLLKAYAPFKVTQRFIAILYTTNFLLLFWMCIVLHFMGHDVSLLIDMANTFWLGEIMMAIIGFYFGGGFAEGFIDKRIQYKKVKEGNESTDR